MLIVLPEGGSSMLILLPEGGSNMLIVLPEGGSPGRAAPGENGRGRQLPRAAYECSVYTG